MDGHIITYSADKPYSARCSCELWESGQQDHRWQAEDLARAHLHNVEVAKASLDRRTPTLKNQAKYYRQMAANPGIGEKYREQWTRLAEELEERIASKTLDPEGQPPLF